MHRAEKNDRSISSQFQNQIKHSDRASLPSETYPENIPLAQSGLFSQCPFGRGDFVNSKYATHTDSNMLTNRETEKAPNVISM